MTGESIIDAEVRTVHPEARRVDFARDRDEPIRGVIYEHADTAGSIDLWSVEAAVASMDENGISGAILSGLAWLDSGILRDNNAYVREALERYPHRFKGLYTPDPSDPERAADEIMNLDARMYVGVELIPKWQGVRIDDPWLDPLFQAVLKRGMYFKIYTAHVTQTLDGDSPYRTFQVLARYPDLKALIPHLGGLLCLYALMPGIDEKLRNAYFITSVSATMRMVEFAAKVNPENLLFGTDFPFNHCHDQETPLREMRTLDLDEPTRRKILGATAHRLFGSWTEEVRKADVPV